MQMPLLVIKSVPQRLRIQVIAGVMQLRKYVSASLRILTGFSFSPECFNIRNVEVSGVVPIPQVRVEPEPFRINPRFERSARGSLEKEMAWL